MNNKYFIVIQKYLWGLETFTLIILFHYTQWHIFKNM